MTSGSLLQAQPLKGLLDLLVLSSASPRQEPRVYLERSLLRNPEEVKAAGLGTRRVIAEWGLLPDWYLLMPHSIDQVYSQWGLKAGSAE